MSHSCYGHIPKLTELRQENKVIILCSQPLKIGTTIRTSTPEIIIADRTQKRVC